MKDKVQTFVFVQENKIISPILTTIREYGLWFEDTFDEYTSQMELYMKSVKKDGTSVLEWHPGTRIGLWFDSNNVNSEKLKCWYILQESTMMDKLRQYNLAEYRDAVPISVNDEQGRRMLRLYTVDQLQLYIRSKIDKAFNISNYVSKPKQVKIRTSDLDKMIMPQVETKRKKLF